jgi:hypothetical protein
MGFALQPMTEDEARDGLAALRAERDAEDAYFETGAAT